MPSEEIDQWLTSGRSALIGSHCLKSAEHTYAKGKPPSSQKGQAEAFFLTDDGGHWWILKKFRSTISRHWETLVSVRLTMKGALALSVLTLCLARCLLCAIAGLLT